VFEKFSSFKTSLQTFLGFGHFYRLSEVVKFELRLGLKPIVLFSHFLRKQNSFRISAEITCRKHRNVDFFYRCLQNGQKLSLTDIKCWHIFSTISVSRNFCKNMSRASYILYQNFCENRNLLTDDFRGNRNVYICFRRNLSRKGLVWTILEKLYFEKFRQIGGIFAIMKVTVGVVVSCIFYPRLLSIHLVPLVSLCSTCQREKV
jgi:hypothetical protein